MECFYFLILEIHGVIGTALGGVSTIVGEPQNLIIATYTKWNFMEYFYTMAPITIPILFIGLLVCVFLEKFKIFGYGEAIPSNVYKILIDYFLFLH